MLLPGEDPPAYSLASDLRTVGADLVAYVDQFIAATEAPPLRTLKNPYRTGTDTVATESFIVMRAMLVEFVNNQTQEMARYPRQKVETYAHLEVKPTPTETSTEQQAAQDPGSEDTKRKPRRKRPSAKK